MTQSSRAVTELKCDRCGHEMDCVGNADQHWASISGAQYRGGTGLIPGHYYKADLCPMCAGSFADWWKEKAEEWDAIRKSGGES